MPRSLRLNAGLADHLGPALGLVPLEFRHVLRAAAAGAQIELAEARLGRGLGEDLVHRPVELQMIGAGVLGGALMAFQVSETKPGMPASISVGMSGSRLSVATARILDLPPSCSLWAKA